MLEYLRGIKGKSNYLIPLKEQEISREDSIKDAIRTKQEHFSL